MKKLLFVVFSLFIQIHAKAQPGKLWTVQNETVIGKNLFERSIRPQEYQIFTLNEQAMKTALYAAPMEPVKRSSPVISIPNPEGKTESFRVSEAPCMEPGLMALYPDIKSYIGESLTEEGTNIRFAYSPMGFSGVVFSVSRGTYYINPTDVESGYYLVVDRKNVPKHAFLFNCYTENDIISGVNQAGISTQRNANDSRLRTYRLAFATSGEFSQHWLNGTETTDLQKRAKVTAALNNIVTQLNSIYEREFSIRFLLVSNNSSVIFLNPATDPWSIPGSGSLTQAQVSSFLNSSHNTINNNVGALNYDIGQLLHKRIGGDIGAGAFASVCMSGSKGKGFNFYNNISSIYLVIDFIAHEIGHQFNAKHIFSDNEGYGSNMEPGSGSTIMGYPGSGYLCNGTGISCDVQAHSDNYFHARNVEEITNYMKSTNGGCAQSVSNGNTPPVANALSDFIIPKSTPFILTGASSDANGDALTHCWEQFDNSTISGFYMPAPTNTTGPLFRSRPPISLVSRTFPEINSILNGSNSNTWEVLPSVARTLNFRFTVRDSRAGGGSNNSDDMIVTVNGATGPFAVTAPNTSVSWVAGTQQTISWSVNGTNGAPINCTNVKISLSTDGGNTFPHILATTTPNDGTETVTIPNTPSAACRIKVEAVGNIFFDISNVHFTITTPLGCAIPTGLGVASTGAFTTSVSWTAIVNALSYDVDYKPASSGTWLPAYTGTTATIVNFPGLNPSTLYDWRVRANCSGSSSGYASAQFTTLAPPCNAPTGLNVTGITPASVTLNWAAVSGAVNYTVEYKTTASSTWTVAASATTATSIFVSTLIAGNTYDWRVRTNCSGNSSSYTSAQFSTGAAPCNAPTGLSASSITQTSATISWAAVSGAVNYTVEYKANASATWITAASATTALSVSLTGLTAGTLYDWRVRANCSGNSSIYTSAQFTTVAPCNAPSGLNTSGITSVSAILNWNAASGAVSYSLDYKTTSSATWINLSNSLTATTFNLSGLLASTTYDWRVRSNCATANSVYATAQFVTLAPPCTRPNGLATLSEQPTSATVSWQTVTGALSYTVEYKLTTASTFTIAFSATTATTVNITGLTPGNEYDWQVKANCSGGVSSQYSIWGSIITPLACNANYEPNETAPASTGIPNNTNLQAGISSATDVDWYTFNLPAASNISISLTTLPANFDLFVYNPAQTEIGRSQNAGTASELVTLNNLPPGDYYIQVAGAGGVSTTTGCYTINAGVTSALSNCGATYDAGNNDFFGGAAFIPMGVVINGLIYPVFDIDYYTFNLSSSSDINVQLFNLPADYDLRLYNSSGSQLGASLAGDVTPESIYYPGAPPGTYYVEVISSIGASSSSSCYSLYVTAGVFFRKKNNTPVTDRVPQQMMIYPNPVKNSMYVSLRGYTGKCAIIIYDQYGKQVLRQPTTQQVTRVNISGLKPGVYMVKTEDADGVMEQAKKFVKQ